jgi:hypothetical protein
VLSLSVVPRPLFCWGSRGAERLFLRCHWLEVEPVLRPWADERPGRDGQASRLAGLWLLLGDKECWARRRPAISCRAVRRSNFSEVAWFRFSTGSPGFAGLDITAPKNGPRVSVGLLPFAVKTWHAFAGLPAHDGSPGGRTPPGFVRGMGFGPARIARLEPGTGLRHAEAPVLQAGSSLRPRIRWRDCPQGSGNPVAWPLTGSQPPAWPTFEASGRSRTFATYRAASSTPPSETPCENPMRSSR